MFASALPLFSVNWANARVRSLISHAIAVAVVLELVTVVIVLLSLAISIGRG
jgi:hypothetical protein